MSFPEKQYCLLKQLHKDMKKNTLTQVQFRLRGLASTFLRVFLISLFMILAFAINSKGESYSQERITIKVKDATLLSILKIIQQKTDYQFLFNSEDVKNAPLVSVSAKNATVTEVLDGCFKNYPFDYKIIDRTIVITKRLSINSGSKQNVLKSPLGRMKEGPPEILLYNNKNDISTKVSIPQLTISGNVTDELGVALSGVTVALKGNPKLSATTDKNGDFSIALENGFGILVFSSVGFELLEKEINNQSIINVILIKKVSSLDEVIVVGYGEQSRATVTGSIAKLDQQVLETVPRSNIGSALQGALPGIQVINTSGQPGSSPSITMRGGASINSPEGPLVVVDGIIRSFNDIPAEDIASIELLKDAAATAIYGARANNGVLLITTKTGKAKGKSQIIYKYTNGFNSERIGYSFLNAKDFIFYNRLGNLNAGRSASEVNTSFGYSIKPNDVNYSAVFDIKFFNSSTEHLLSQGWDTVGDPYGGTIIFKDHGGEITKMFMRRTNTNNHFTSLSGHNEKGSYYSSFNYYKELGMIIGSEYRRFTGRLNGSYKIKPNVEVNSGFTASTSSQIGINGTLENGVSNLVYRTLAIWPTLNPWLDEAKTQPNPGRDQTNGNPLYWLSKRNVGNEENNITGQVGLKWKVFKGLIINGTGSFFYHETLGESFTKAQQTFDQILADPPIPGNVTRPSNAIYQKDFQQQYNVTINYKTSINKNEIDILIGSEYYRKNQFLMNLSGTQAPTDDISTVNASTVFVPADNYSRKKEFGIISQFGRLNYNFDRRYLFSLSFRRDGVSSLPQNSQFGFFPGVSVGWNIHEEKFWEKQKLSSIVSTMKYRMGYGINGNVSGLSEYEVQGVYSAQGLYDGFAGVLNTQLPNSTLTWERSKTLNIGFDLGFLENRITVLVDYYRRVTSNLLTNLILPDYTGYNSIKTNFGTFLNRGFETAINGVVLSTPNGFKWSLGVNGSYNRNTIVKLPDNGQPGNRQGGFQVFDQNTKQIIWVAGLQEGQSPGAVYAFKNLGIYKDEEEVSRIAGKRYDAVANLAGPDVLSSSGALGLILPGDVNWLDVDENDIIDSRDQVYIGNINPKWTGGFSTSLSYKNFSLYSQFNFNIGNIIYNDFVARIMGNYNGSFNYITLMKESWSESNPNTMIPRVYRADQVVAPGGRRNYLRANGSGAITPQSNNSYFYESGDYLACRELTLTYDLKAKILQSISFFEGGKVFISGYNLFYIKKFSGPSPEAPILNGSISGVYLGGYATPRTFVFGVQISL